MSWGIIITIIGIVQVAMGTFLIIYGPSMIHKDHVPQVISENNQKLLSPPQFKLLKMLYEIQAETGANKLIITSNNGALYWDNEKMREKYSINIFKDFYSIDSDFEKKRDEFENMIHSIPEKYLQRIPEMRFDSPYVVKITEEGISYLQSRKLQ